MAISTSAFMQQEAIYRQEMRRREMEAEMKYRYADPYSMQNVYNEPIRQVAEAVQKKSKVLLLIGE